MKLNKLFNVDYPPTLIFAEQKLDETGINFVSSAGKNCGVVGRVKKNSKNILYEKGSITVPLKGSVLRAFVQPEKFYIAHQIAVLTPLNEMSFAEKLYYCICIRHNKYRYNYGRQADRTLRELDLPNEKPSFVNEETLLSITEKSNSIFTSALN